MEDRGWAGRGKKGKGEGEREGGRGEKAWEGEKKGIRREGINLPHGRLKTLAALLDEALLASQSTAITKLKLHC